MSDRDILWEILELRHDDSVTKDDIMAMIREHLEEESRNAEQVRPKLAEPYDPVLHCINSPEWKAAERKIREEAQDAHKRGDE